MKQHMMSYNGHFLCARNGWALVIKIVLCACGLENEHVDTYQSMKANAVRKLFVCLMLVILQRTQVTLLGKRGSGRKGKYQGRFVTRCYLNWTLLYKFIICLEGWKSKQHEQRHTSVKMHDLGKPRHSVSLEHKVHGSGITRKTD